MPERSAGSDVEPALAPAIPAIDPNPAPGCGGIGQPLSQAWLPSPFDPWAPTRAGHAGGGWGVEGGIKGRPGDQGQVGAPIAQARQGRESAVYYPEHAGA